MKLIDRNELSWDDLAKIESPWFALSEVKKVLEDGRFIHLQFGQTISDASTKAEQEKFLNDIECGELFMIHDNPLWHQPFDPILCYKYDGMYPLDGRCIMGKSMSSAFLEQLVKELYDTKFNNAAEAQAWWKTFADRRYPPVTAAKKEEVLESVSRKNFYQGLGTEGYETHPDIAEPKAGDRIHKRVHKDGDPSDTYTLMADGKPMGASAGVMPSSMEGMKIKPMNHDTLVKQGWPDLDASGRNGKGKKDYKNFANVEPVELPPGKTIYRIVDEKAGNAGGYWADELPKNKAEWRQGAAVKDSWNDNGYYVKHTVGSKGLKAWEGNTAGQGYKKVGDSDFYLQGGNKQFYIEPNNISTSEPSLTNWPEA